MATQTHEHTINIALGEVLDGLGQTWNVQSERVGDVFEGGGRPDILIEKPDGWPIVVEAEVGNHHQAEVEARSRLGKKLARSTATVETSLALVYPADLRKHSGAQLRAALASAPLEYAVVSVGSDDVVTRLPERGWLTGGVRELALVLHRSSVAPWRVEALATSLQAGVEQTAGTFTAAHAAGSSVGTAVANALRQSDDAAGQTRKMAMTVVVNALVFHEALAEAGMLIRDTPRAVKRAVGSPSNFRSHGSFRPTPLIEEWDKILRVNYWPIFYTAGAILRAMPTRTRTAVLNSLWETAEELVAGGVTKSHDLTGVVFQRLIADRKFLATYYTRPAAAALLAGLAISADSPPRGGTWVDATRIGQLRIGDLACGTGTLLSTVYQRIGLLHEVHGGNPKAIHPTMMRGGLIGLDVLNVAVHLTAAMLAGSHPDTPFEGECLLTMPYGRQTWGVAVGSLDLLSQQESFDIIQAAAQTAGGKGEEEVRDLIARVGHGQIDVAIMNPPFTRHGAREGDRTEVHNPAFAAFGAGEEEQTHMAAHLRRLGRGSEAHGHAGMASYFSVLAHRKVASAGTVALVLPLTAMSGGSWERVRDLWRVEYSSPIVVTIAERGTHTRSFSADTGMAECLFVARKDRPARGAWRATFVVLDGQPQNALEGELIAQQIQTIMASGTVRKLEDGPFGGTRFSIGDTFAGEVLDCPLPEDGPWQMVGIRDFTLGQTAFKLSQGQLWIEGMAQGATVTLPVATVGEVAERIGPHHLDLTGSEVKSDGLPQGPFDKTLGCPAGAAYPSLWAHDSTRERSLVVEPDSHCRVRSVSASLTTRIRARVDERWATASRIHYNTDLQFNSQSLVVAFTARPTIGGRAWPTVVFADSKEEYAYALWCNSTLGLLAHWWMANKSQAGRGSVTPSAIPAVPALDLRKLTQAQFQAAKNAFDDLAGERFLPFDQIDEDPARAELDERLLVDVLRMPPALCAPGGSMELLRRKLATEPQIHSNKQTRVVFTAQGEESQPRAARPTEPPRA